MTQRLPLPTRTQLTSTITDLTHTIAQQQARITELEAARESERVGLATYKEQADRLQQALAAERERAEELKLALDKADPLDPSFLRYLELEARIAALERQLERHAVLLHSANHNWKLYGVADCPELECKEYRALFSPAPEEK